MSQEEHKLRKIDVAVVQALIERHFQIGIYQLEEQYAQHVMKEMESGARDTDLAVSFRFQYGRLLLSQYHYSAAFEQFTTIAKDHIQDIQVFGQAIIESAAIMQIQDRLQDAISYLRSILDTVPQKYYQEDVHSVAFILARLHELKDNQEQAAIYWKQALGKNWMMQRLEAGTWIQFGDLCFNNHNPILAVDAYVEAMKHSLFADPHVHYKLIISYLLIGEHRAATKALTKALNVFKFDPNLRKLYRRMAPTEYERDCSVQDQSIVVIQKQVRRKQRHGRYNSAVEIQKIARGYLERRRHQEKQRQLDLAAKRLQVWYRDELRPRIRMRQDVKYHVPEEDIDNDEVEELSTTKPDSLHMVEKKRAIAEQQRSIQAKIRRRKQEKLEKSTSKMKQAFEIMVKAPGFLETKELGPAVQGYHDRVLRQSKELEAAVEKTLSNHQDKVMTEERLEMGAFDNLLNKEYDVTEAFRNQSRSNKRIASLKMSREAHRKAYEMMKPLWIEKLEFLKSFLYTHGSAFGTDWRGTTLNYLQDIYTMYKESKKEEGSSRQGSPVKTRLELHIRQCLAKINAWSFVEMRSGIDQALELGLNETYLQLEPFNFSFPRFQGDTLGGKRSRKPNTAMQQAEKALGMIALVCDQPTTLQVDTPIAPRSIAGSASLPMLSPPASVPIVTTNIPIHSAEHQELMHGSKPNSIEHQQLMYELKQLKRQNFTRDNVSGIRARYHKLLKDCSIAGAYREAFKALHAFEKVGLEPVLFTYQLVIQACKNANPPQAAKAEYAFQCMKKRGVLPTSSILNILLNICGSCGHWRRAITIFKELTSPPFLVPVTTATYETLCQACRHVKIEEAPHVYDALKFAGVPEFLAYSTANKVIHTS